MKWQGIDFDKYPYILEKDGTKVYPAQFWKKDYLKWKKRHDRRILITRILCLVIAWGMMIWFMVYELGIFSDGFLETIWKSVYNK